MSHDEKIGGKKKDYERKLPEDAASLRKMYEYVRGTSNDSDRPSITDLIRSVHLAMASLASTCSTTSRLSRDARLSRCL